MSEQEQFSPKRRDFLKILVASGASAALGSGTSARAEGGAMATRKIPSSGEALPAVGVGTWQSFDVSGTDEQLAPRREVLDVLFDHGGSVIDSSPMYGRAETVVGRLLEEMRGHEPAFLATKVWTRGKQAGIGQMEDSFRKLRADRIDLMQVHNLVDWKTHLPTLRAWKEEGRVRYIGITHYQASAYGEMMRLMRQEPWDFIQLNYSILRREAEEEILPLAAERGVAVLVNRPYVGGSWFSVVRGRALPDWAREFDCESWGQFSLKYVLSHPAVTCVIPGTGNPKHVRDNVRAAFGRMPDEKTRRRMVELVTAL